MYEFNIIDIVGSIGVIIVVGIYLLLQLEIIGSKSLTFSLLNTVGSMMILYSLMYNWNLASFLIESFWILISLFGVYKYFRKQHLTS